MNKVTLENSPDSFRELSELSVSLNTFADKCVPRKYVDLFKGNQIQQSCFGHLITMYYMIEIQGVMDNFWCNNSNPKVACPIDIIHKEVNETTI